MHQRTHSGYRPGKYIMPHEHMFPVNGFLSVDVNGSDTLLRSPITGRVFKLGGRAGRMVLFPGGVRSFFTIHSLDSVFHFCHCYCSSYLWSLFSI